MSRLGVGVLVATVCFSDAACMRAPDVPAPSDSEVATSAVSGALNNTSGSTVAWNAPTPARGPLDRLIDAVNPIGTAWAAEWTCTGGSLSPAFSGPGGDPYSFAPVSCSVTWGNHRTASSDWSGAFLLNYGSSCDGAHAFIENQAAGCSVARTTATGGNTRTITGPDGNSYSILHDTHGAGTGWDFSVTPAPSDAGVTATCGAGGCPSSRTLVINGSHLTGTVTIDGKATTIWDHTVSTGQGGIMVTGTSKNRVVSGSVTVQHNLLKYTATATFDSVGYGAVGCCFPTSGDVTTTFSDGPDTGKTEKLSFTPFCGEALLTTTSGKTGTLTLQHCL
jgi:hypothetical protein